MHQPPLCRIYLLALPVLASWLPVASAFEQYSLSRDAGNCADSHGNFRVSPYMSPAGGQDWGDDLHDVQSNTMLSGDCNTYHRPSGRFPVLLDSSAGGTGFDPNSCIGWHGRTEVQEGSSRPAWSLGNRFQIST